MKITAIASTAALLALPAAASQIVPAQPVAFELVNLRMNVDSCAFEPSTVRVRALGNVLKVTQQPNNCFAPGTPELADVRLGALASGDYRVEVYASSNSDGPPAETLALQVREAVEIAVFPPPTRPLTDYTGLWGTPGESGWGLSLHQGPGSNALFGAWFAYGASGQPEWFTLQGGQWVSSTRWTGQVLRTTGPYFAGPDFDPRLVLVQAAGTATLDFKLATGGAGGASFTYSVNGQTTTKAILRVAL